MGVERRKCMKKMRKWTTVVLALCMMLLMSLNVCAKESKAEVTEIQKYGNLVLSVSGTELLAEGYAYGDVITVGINDASYEMPICSDYSDVDEDNMVCRVSIDAQTGEDRVILAVNMGQKRYCHKD